MTDASVHAALRSDAPLVVVEAPAGCGKTYQGAEYARSAARGSTARILILTHTHAACSVFAERTHGQGSQVEIRTIDSLIASIAGAYRISLQLPEDAAGWARRTQNGYQHLARKVADLCATHPMITAALAARYPTIICDEHQDCSGDQHALCMALLASRAKLRIFADPVQRIYQTASMHGSRPLPEWPKLVASASLSEELDTPHRWNDGCPDLGRWTLTARASLKAGGKIDLRSDLPSSVTIVSAENTARRHQEIQLPYHARAPIDTFIAASTSLLVLTRYNAAARSLRSAFNRRLALWEGHTRPALETFSDALKDHAGDGPALAGDITAFMKAVGKGFSPTSFANVFEQEVRDQCNARRRGKPAKIQGLAKLLVSEPDHRGVGKVLAALADLQTADRDFTAIEIDHRREFWEAVRLCGFADPDTGLAEITHRRTFARPKPPAKAISTIHKAKGLECDCVALISCDAVTFPDREDARNLLYVALSRAKHRLLLVVSPDAASPLLQF